MPGEEGLRFRVLGLRLPGVDVLRQVADRCRLGDAMWREEISSFGSLHWVAASCTCISVTIRYPEEMLCFTILLICHALLSRQVAAKPRRIRGFLARVESSEKKQNLAFYLPKP